MLYLQFTWLWFRRHQNTDHTARLSPRLLFLTIHYLPVAWHILESHFNANPLLAARAGAFCQ
jgi:hypothetical protein